MGAKAQAKLPTWTCGLDDIFDSPHLCRLAPEPGQRLYVTDIVAQNTTVTGGVFRLQYGTAVALGGLTDCGTDTSTLFPSAATVAARISAPGNAARPASISMRRPLIVPPGKDLCVEGDSANSITIQLFGYVAP